MRSAVIADKVIMEKSALDVTRLVHSIVRFDLSLSEDLPDRMHKQNFDEVVGENLLIELGERSVERRERHAWLGRA